MGTFVAAAIFLVVIVTLIGYSFVQFVGAYDRDLEDEHEDVGWASMPGELPKEDCDGYTRTKM